MKTKIKKLLPLLCGTLLVLTFQVRSETTFPPTGNCLFWHTCEITQKSYFEFAEGTDLGQLDFGDLMYGKQQVIREYVEQCYEPTSGLKVTRTLLNPEEAVNPWMTPVFQSIITGNGVRLLDNQLQEIGFYPPGDLQSDHWSAIENEIAQSGFSLNVSFDYPSAAEIADLQSSGFQFFDYPDGRFSYSNDETEVIVDPVNLRIETNELVEGELKFSTIEGFTQATEGAYYKSFSIEKSYQVLPGGACGSFVTITHYTNVTNNQHVTARSSIGEGPIEAFKTDSPIQSNQLGTMEIFPNPARDQVSVYLSNLLESEGMLSLKLLGANGKIVLERRIFNQDFINLSLEALPKGVYILNVSSNKQSISKKLLKN